MEKNKELTEKLAKDIKKKTVRKYALIALMIVIVVAGVLGLNIEDKDSKLPDGQGNVVNNEQLLDEDVTDESTDVEDEAEDKNKQSENKQSENKQSENKQSGTSSTTTDKTTSDKTTSEDIKVDNTKDPTASNDGNVSLKPDEEEQITVTISIRCDTLSSDMSKLTDKSVAPYIPSNGVILAKTTYKCTTENTVFDALNTVCRNNGIQIEYSYAALYESYYVEGINYLYEFDAGNTSGWMYKVNGWFPNYGCSSYYLSDGDVIEWVYTCDLGADVGDNSMG